MTEQQVDSLSTMDGKRKEHLARREGADKNCGRHSKGHAENQAKRPQETKTESRNTNEKRKAQLTQDKESIEGKLQGAQQLSQPNQEHKNEMKVGQSRETAAAVSARRKRKSQKTATSAEILNELSDIALGRKEYPDYTAKGEEFGAFPAMTARLKALELLCKHYSLFSETNSAEEGPFLVEIRVQDEIEDKPSV